MKKLFEWLNGTFFKGVTNLIDEVVTSDEERMAIKEKLASFFSSQALELSKLQSDIIQTEAKGNFLQRSWRPIMMLMFGFIVVYSKFIAVAFGLPNAMLEPEFWELLRLGIGGYVIGRSGEKIVSQIVSNIDFKKK